MYRFVMLIGGMGMLYYSVHVLPMNELESENTQLELYIDVIHESETKVTAELNECKHNLIQTELDSKLKELDNEKTIDVNNSIGTHTIKF